MGFRGVLVLILITIFVASYALALPVGTGSLAVINSSRGNNSGAGVLDIQGGNVTNLGIINSGFTIYLFLHFFCWN